jgi:hypothetical protein
MAAPQDAAAPVMSVWGYNVITVSAQTRLLESPKGEYVAQHFVIELSRGEAKIIKTYAEKRAQPGDATNREPAYQES